HQQRIGARPDLRHASAHREAHRRPPGRRAVRAFFFYCFGMLASRTTATQRSFSARMNAANSSCVVGDASMLLSARRAFLSGSSSVLMTVACSLSRIGFATAACVHTPYHTVTSKPA